MAIVADLPPRKVLVVDDSKFVRATFVRILESSFAVREEPDGEAGWRAIESDPSIVMVFSDLNMPKLDGFGLLNKIRASKEERVKTMPVIIISGEEDEKTKKKARDAGANDFIAKSADAPEVLARIDNLLRLVQAKQDVEVNRQAVEQTATHDPLTGAFTPHFLLTQGNKVYSQARRHGGPLSVVCFRIDSFHEIIDKVGKEVADQLLGRIARAVIGTLRAEDSMGRSGEAQFTILSASTGPVQALAFARRLRDQLESAHVTYQRHPLKIRASIGLASIGNDTVGSIEDLIKLATHRMQQAASRKEERIVGQDDLAFVKPPSLPSDIERAVQTLEYLNAERLGEGSNEILRRLLPFIDSAVKRLHVSFPADELARALQDKKPG